MWNEIKNGTTKEGRIWMAVITVFGAPFGINRFIKEDWKMGLLWLCTFGGCMVGWIYDSILAIKFAVYEGDQLEELRQIEQQKAINREKQKILKENSKQEKLDIKRQEYKIKNADKIKTNSIIAENKRKRVAYCPKCGSTSIQLTNKKLSIGRAAVGGAIAGSAGAVMGGLSSKKMYCVCLNCGYTWKPGKK